MNSLRSVLQAYEEKTLLQLGLLEPLPEQQAKVLYHKIIAAHGEEMPGQVVRGMVIAHRMRAAAMAEAMISSNLGDGVVLIAAKRVKAR